MPDYTNAYIKQSEEQIINNVDFFNKLEEKLNNFLKGLITEKNIINLNVEILDKHLANKSENYTDQTEKDCKLTISSNNDKYKIPETCFTFSLFLFHNVIKPDLVGSVYDHITTNQSCTNPVKENSKNAFQVIIEDCLEVFYNSLGAETQKPKLNQLDENELVKKLAKLLLESE